MLLRRWIWVVAALVIALVAGAGAYKVVGPGQESRAEVLFVPSVKQPGVVGATNPFRNLDTSLSVVASVVQAAVTDDKTAVRLVQAGHNAKYSVAPNLAQNAGPSLLVKVDDKSPALTQGTLSAVLTEINRALNTLQSDRGIPTSLFIKAVVVTASTHPAPVHKTQMQLAVIALVSVLFLLVILILLVERKLMRRRPTAPTTTDNASREWSEPQYRGRKTPDGPPPRRVRRTRKVDGPTAGTDMTSGVDDLRTDEQTRSIYASSDHSD